MADSQYFSSLNLPERGLNLSGFREVQANQTQKHSEAFEAKRTALNDALAKGMGHVEVFSEARLLEHGKHVQTLLQKGSTEDGLTPEELLDLTKAQADIASLLPLIVEREGAEPLTVYARPKVEAAE